MKKYREKESEVNAIDHLYLTVGLNAALQFVLHVQQIILALQSLF